MELYVRLERGTVPARTHPDKHDPEVCSAFKLHEPRVSEPRIPHHRVVTAGHRGRLRLCSYSGGRHVMAKTEIAVGSAVVRGMGCPHNNTSKDEY